MNNFVDSKVFLKALKDGTADKLGVENDNQASGDVSDNVPFVDSGAFLDGLKTGNTDDVINQAKQSIQTKNNFKNLPPEEKEKVSEDMLDYILRTVAKTGRVVAKGTAGVLDMPVSLINLGIMGVNKLAGTDIGQIPNQAQKMGELYNIATNNYAGEETPQERIAQEFVSMANAGGAAKVLAKGGQKVASKFADFMGTTEKLPLAAGTAGVAVMEGLNKLGASEGSQFVGGAITDIGIQALSHKRLPFGTRTLGTGTKINTELVDKSKDLGVDVSGDMLTDSNRVALLNQIASKSPASHTIVEHNQKMSKQMQDAVDKTGGMISKRATSDEAKILDEKISDLYEQAANTISANKTVNMQNTKKVAQEIKQNLLKSKTPDPAQTKVLQYLEKLDNEMYQRVKSSGNNIYNINGKDVDISTLPQHIQTQILDAMSGKEIPWKLGELAYTKQSLNGITGDIYKNPGGAKAKKLLLKLAKAMRDDVSLAAKDSPDFVEPFKKADNLFSQKMKREFFDEITEKATRDPKTGEFNYGKFTKTINDKDIREKIIDQFEPKVAKRIFDIMEIAKAKSNSLARTPNPSGTAMVSGILKVADDLYKSVVSGNIKGVGKAILAGTGSSRSADLLTNPKLLNKIYEYAKNPNATYAKRLVNTLKSQTGLSLKELEKVLSEHNKEIKTTDSQKP